eukprot:CAMPEP_0195336930 /NCGR_PEP_ID=MMETSP0708-20121125/16562_1 /TAXON_ID=33640 /ORGANISM="Asterionellopsis glacialis, Strain CCMP134" /LENGTH=150 /DNA_ID=CAMNT_0040407765 /DNA_START=72 /DNA_END=525 /DNA_ORIENTATION=-
MDICGHALLFHKMMILPTRFEYSNQRLAKPTKIDKKVSKEFNSIFHQTNRSDQHLPGAFRHYIEIRDDIFPPHWKNLKDNPSGEFAVGDRVEENWQNKGKWYNGIVSKVYGGDKYDVKFDDGGFEHRVPAKRIRSTDSNVNKVGMDDFYA